MNTNSRNLGEMIIGCLDNLQQRDLIIIRDAINRIIMRSAESKQRLDIRIDWNSIESWRDCRDMK